MKLPEPQDFLDYVEGASPADPLAQARVLQLLASSSQLRERCAEWKRDLYLVEVQIPEYRVSPQFGADLTKLAGNWLKVSLARKYSWQAFTKTREFLFVLTFIGASLLLTLALIALRLKN